MKTKPYVGQKVHLNNTGLQTIWGSTLGLNHMKSKELIITWVDDESITYPEDTWVVEVNDPDINMYMLNQWLFD